MKWFLIVLALAAIGGGLWYWLTPSEAAAPYRTAKIERGDISVTVTATGNVQPVTQVQVGTQVTGVIQKLGADFNSIVKENQVIAQIDPAPFQARVEQDKANLTRAEADIERVKATLTQAEKELARSRELARRELISPSELDASEANYKALVAQLKVAEASVAQSKAALDNSMVNLRYTTIVSPVDGIVISRNVDVGQTVSASLSAPTLFVIAANLKKIQIQASVSEADIGKIFEGQEVTFTVDAYRMRRFEGEVSQVRLAPTTVQNVVTYTVIINAENPEEKLLPGMTASVQFQVDRKEGVLKIPNAALRFTPPEEAPKRGARVWVQTPTGLSAVEIRAGLSDGSFTELVKGELKEGQEIVTGLAGSKDSAPVTNPFGPAPRPGGRMR